MHTLARVVRPLLACLALLGVAHADSPLAAAKKTLRRQMKQAYADRRQGKLPMEFPSTVSTVGPGRTTVRSFEIAKPGDIDGARITTQTSYKRGALRIVDENGVTHVGPAWSWSGKQGRDANGRFLSYADTFRLETTTWHATPEEADRVVQRDLEVLAQKKAGTYVAKPLTDATKKMLQDLWNQLP